MEIKTLMLKGKVQNYAWGGKYFLPSLLNIENTDEKPFAEYWMGAHPSSPSVISNGTEEMMLDECIKSNPAKILSKDVAEKFGGLPYLFKILDVSEMLSIQVHPTKQEAEKGFDAEEKAGVPITASHRNYKDRNHKPEVMVALSEFWLLHGFKEKESMEKTLNEIPEFNYLLPLFISEGNKGLYRFVMELDQDRVDALLVKLVNREIHRFKEGLLDKTQPGWWVNKWYKGNEVTGNIDRGIFSIYFFNIVRVNPGEAVFQDAGIPHAYLEGQNVELMANSDNVLRGGLTPKHIDVGELLKHTLFTGIAPNILKGDVVGDNCLRYPCPVADFGIEKISLNANYYIGTSSSLEILIITEGNAKVLSCRELIISKGEAVAFLPGEAYRIEGLEGCILFKAYVPNVIG